MNIVVLSGNLTREPEVKQLGSGTSVANFSIAVNRRYKDSQGQWAEETSFFDCEAWGYLADNVGKNLKKGSGVVVTGSLKQERWTATDDAGKQQNRSKIVVKADKFEVVERRAKSEDTEDQAAATAAATANNSGVTVGNPDEDIPF